MNSVNIKDYANMEPEEKMTVPQLNAWENRVINGYAKGAEKSTDNKNDPYVFYATTVLGAARIREFGFPQEDIEQTPGKIVKGVTWTSAEIASQKALELCAPDDLPVVIAARASDVMASGRVGPDVAAQRSPHRQPFSHVDRPVDAHRRDIRTWRDSYNINGSLTVQGGRTVRETLQLDMPNLPYHPDAPAARAARLNTPDVLQPLPGSEKLPDGIRFAKASDLFDAPAQDTTPAVDLTEEINAGLRM